MESMLISQVQAREIILHAAGLARKAQFGSGIEAVYQLIDQLGFVQLDTNYVVERAHHHVMYARIPDYETQWLTELADDCRIFEYFTSDAGFIPMKDFLYSLPVKQAFATQRKEMTKAEHHTMKQVLDRVEREGPLGVGDFDDDRVAPSTGWWDWRPAKVALERLYLDGDLMIARTKGFKKVYDLPLNLIPTDTDVMMPSAEEFARYVIRRTLGALGIAGIKEMLWRARRVKGNLVKKELELMLAEGKIKSIVVEGLKVAPQFILSDQNLEIDLKGDVFILSPFDIVNVFRHRLRDFFNFDYQIECFVPAPKRIYGYFSLPILAGDTFIARMDAKADRKRKLLIIHNLHFEGADLNELTIGKFATELKSFMEFNQCRDISFNKTNQEKYVEAIKEVLFNNDSSN